MYPPGFVIGCSVPTSLSQIDWEESTLSSRICIRPHIDEELDNRKHVYNGIDAVLVRPELMEGL